MKEVLFKPMLSATADPKNIALPAVVSAKLDGIRCLVIDGVAVSRTLKPIPNAYIQRCLSKPEFNGLDGELIVGSPTDKDCYRNSNSGVMSHDGEPDFKFYVFDTVTDAPFTVRYSAAKRVAEEHPDIMVAHEHRLVSDLAALQQLEETWLEQGYEGVMLRKPDGPYKNNRSTLKEGFLVKLKRFETDEAEIIGFEELMHNMNEAKVDALGHTERASNQENLVPGNTLGALIVRDIKSGTEFKIGTGFDAVTRQEIWGQRAQLIGRIVSYQHFPIGVKDKPRFPSYRGFRDPIDM